MKVKVTFRILATLLSVAVLLYILLYIAEEIQAAMAPSPWEIFAPPGSYCVQNGEYIPVPIGWTC